MRHSNNIGGRGAGHVSGKLGFSFFPLPILLYLCYYYYYYIRQVRFCYYFNDQIRFNYGQPWTKENGNKSVKKDGWKRDVALPFTFVRHNANSKLLYSFI